MVNSGLCVRSRPSFRKTRPIRSEEHTSELQSQSNLVCRLLLEKKIDNTYCDSDGSADGHNWGMGAYATDYVIKGEPNNQIYDFEGGNPLAYPREGYLWDLCRRHGISYRSYGEFVFNGASPADTVRAGIEGLVGHVAPRYLGYDTHYSDLD